MNAGAKDIIILIEQVERELPANVLLAAELAGRGHNVWLVEKTRFRTAPGRFPPCIVLEKGLTRGCGPVFEAARRAGHVLAVMCQEALIYRSGEDYRARRVSETSLQAVDHILLWGQRHADDLRPLVQENQGFHITGNPRFDLLQSPFHRIWQEDTDAIKGEYGDFILVTSRFGAVNHFSRSVEQTVERRREGYFGTARETVDRRFQTLEQLFSAFKSDIRRLTRRFPRRRFVLRPHLIENLDTWREHFSADDNVDVVRTGPAMPWLNAAQGVIHNGCTTGIEAFMLGKRVIEFQPDSVPRSEFDPVLPGKVTGTCGTVDELAEWLDGSVESEATTRATDIVDEQLSFHLANYGTADSYLRIADALESIQAPTPAGRWKALANRLRPSRQSRKKQKLDQSEVQYWLERLATAGLSCAHRTAERDGALGIRV